MICLFPLFEAPTSPVRNRPDFFRENFPEDPSTWSVDEVITFLQDVDPLTLDPLVDLFREHVMYLLIWFFCLNDFELSLCRPFS